MFHIYSFGEKDRNFVILTPKQAQTMNDFTDCFLYSQEKHLENTGRRWDPLVDPSITMYIPDENPKLVKKYNKIVSVLNPQHTLRNKIYDLLRIKTDPENTEDHLIKRF